MRVWLFWHVDCGRRTGGRNLWLLLEREGGRGGGEFAVKPGGF